MRAFILTFALAIALTSSGSGCGFLLRSVVDASRGGGAPLTLDRELRGITAGGWSHRTISCGAASGSPQREHGFTAPVSGSYTFTSSTTDYDGVLAVFDASGQPLACNDDTGSTRLSQVTVTLTAGQSVTVVQGGYSGASGSYVLSATRPSASEPFAGTVGLESPPPPREPPGVLALGQPMAGSTAGRAPLSVTCPPSSPMQEWAFVAPSDGAFLFQIESTYDAYLGIVDDAGTAIACNDDYGDTRHARVSVEMSAGQSARIVVGGYAAGSGSYVIGAVPLSRGGALTLGEPMLFDPGTTSSVPDLCGAEPGSIDRTFTFTPDDGGFYSIATDASATLVLAEGPRTSACMRVGPGMRAGVAMSAGSTYTIVLELGAGAHQAQTIAIERIASSGSAWTAPVPSAPLASFFER